MKLKNTTGEGRKICDGDYCALVKNGEVFVVSEALGAKLAVQGFTEVKPKTPANKGDK